MTVYAKFVDETTIEEAPNNKGSLLNYNLNVEAMTKDGYKPVVVTECPADMMVPQKRYRHMGDYIEQSFVESYVDPEPVVLTYAEKRAVEYPYMSEYLDAQVKINSGDADLVAEGQTQLAAYYADCLAVKAKYPKTPNKTEA